MLPFDKLLMKTEIIKINPKSPNNSIIKFAASIIRRGGLVGFPTETVYGLGADALNPDAVKKIFKIKKRPVDNPLIVHIARKKDLRKLVENIPPKAKILIKKFWPGPLTLVLNKSSIVPKEVTAGGETVAIRMPKNPVALALIRAAKTPIAAPSANLAGKPSPTKAEHVLADFDKKIGLIIDGGQTSIGLESTVLDLTENPPVILRPGGITKECLEKIIGKVETLKTFKGGKAKSPGLKYRHYAPKARMILVAGNMNEIIKKIKRLADFYKRQNKKIGIMASAETKKYYNAENVILSVGSRKKLKTVARNLFSVLREFDRLKVEIILAESFPETKIGCAIQNRLKRAASRVY